MEICFASLNLIERYGYNRDKNITLKALLTIILLFNITTAYCQKPQPVYPYSREQHPATWYKEQSILWKNEINRDSGNAIAWYNLYYAKRLLSFHDEQDKRSGTQKQEETNALIKDMERAIPGTYELNLVKWLAGGLNLNQLNYLKKADELGANRTEHLDHMMNVAEIQGNISDKYEYAKRKYDAGQVSAGMLYYNYNVLAGLDSNAILVTIGDNDTYPAWVLQALGVRRDVHILNLSMLLQDDYRKRVFEDLGVSNIKVDWSVPNNSDEVESAFYKVVPRLLASNKKGLSFYIGLTAAHISEVAVPNIQDKLYLVGLTYRYSSDPLDNMALLKKNFEQLYALDYLNNAFYSDIAAALTTRINGNYIVPMIKLYDHYKASGELQKMKWIEEKLLSVSKKTQYEEEVKKHIARR